MPASGPERLVALLHEARGGSSEALGQLLQIIRPYLLAIANDELASDLRPKGGASDLVQETFLEAVRDFPAFRGSSEAELVAWFRQILLNNVANFSRQFHKAAKRQVALELPLDHSSQRDLREWLSEATPVPVEQLERREDMRRLEAAIEGLPAQYREVVVWRNLDLLPFEEIARRLDRTEKAAQKLWARAIRALEQLLAQNT